MQPFYVHLMSISDVKRFVGEANRQPCDIDIVSGRYIIDAKSIMGVFSIDLEKAIQVEVHGTAEDRTRFMSAVSDLIVSPDEMDF